MDMSSDVVCGRAGHTDQTRETSGKEGVGAGSCLSGVWALVSCRPNRRNPKAFATTCGFRPTSHNHHLIRHTCA
jgi:hypothetical protein